MNRRYVRNNARAISLAVIAWGGKNFKKYPWRKPHNDWLTLIAEILLQRTRAASVVPVFEAFAKRFPNPEMASGAGQDAVGEVVAPLGLRWRVPLIHQLSIEISDRDLLPDNYEDLTALPGVGDYTASAYLSLHRNKRAILVDANIVRWICRMTGNRYTGETRRKSWLINLVRCLTPNDEFRQYNYGILDFTMTICAKKPLCGSCPVYKYCKFGNDRA